MQRCGISLQKWTKIVAIIDIGFSVSGFILYFLLMISPTDYSQNQELPIDITIFETDPNPSQTLVKNTNDCIDKIGPYKIDILDLSILAIVVFMVDIWVAITLLNGSIKRSHKDCFFWFKIRFACLIFGVIFYIFYAIQDRISPSGEIYLLVLFVFRALAMWQVLSYIKYITEGFEMQKLADMQREIELEEVKS